MEEISLTKSELASIEAKPSDKSRSGSGELKYCKGSDVCIQWVSSIGT